MLRTFRACWKSLLLTDIVFKIIAFVVLIPLVGLLFRMFVVLSGRNILADLDILYFFLHPIGWVCGIAVGGVFIAILALEHATLLLIAAAASEGKSISCRQALTISFYKSHAILYLTVRFVALTLLTSIPFLAVGSGLYFLMLTQHDINYYLAAKPD